MDYKLLSKNIEEYLLRVFCLILVAKCFFSNLVGVFGLIVLPIIIIEMIFKPDLTQPDLETTIPVAEFTTFDMYLLIFATLYILAKIFGIFKKLDKLNIFTSLIIVSEISCLLIPAFLLYKFFGFLTVKFPVPFKKIGYYTSIEFPKDLYSKIKKNYIQKP